MYHVMKERYDTLILTSKQHPTVMIRNNSTVTDNSGLNEHTVARGLNSVEVSQWGMYTIYFCV